MIQTYSYKTTQDFFEAVKAGISKLDMLNYVEFYTDKFQSAKIYALSEDLLCEIMATEQEYLEKLKNEAQSTRRNKLLAEYNEICVNLNFLQQHIKRWINPLKSNSDRTSEKDYTQRQIAIAYFIMGITITEYNMDEILKKHSRTTSKKILQKLFTKNNQLTTLSNNKTADTKHLNDLFEAQRLMSGIKNKKGLSDIKPIIRAFETTYKSRYEITTTR